ncbi:helix-turn-helix domain-containing protein (plasmid) [Spirosoma sp. KUDC1026]|nr:helix-turn-helix domain-containing protein [Spirosoma sp. KUDC1026]
MKRPVGRPTDYREEYAEQARKLCLLGATDKELAAFFCVAESTLNLWKIKVPEFSESLRAGKEIADAQVAQKLFDRATGAVWSEQQAFKVKTGKGMEEVKIVTVIKAAPPDTQAALGWLQNRRPDLWRKRMDAPADPGNVPEDYQQTLSPDEPTPDNAIL